MSSPLGMICYTDDWVLTFTSKIKYAQYCQLWTSSLRKKTKTRGILPSNSIRIIKRKFHLTEMSLSDWFVVLIRHNTRHSKNRISFAILDQFTPQKEHYWWHSIIKFFLYPRNGRQIQKNVWSEQYRLRRLLTTKNFTLPIIENQDELKTKISSCETSVAE